MCVVCEERKHDQVYIYNGLEIKRNPLWYRISFVILDAFILLFCSFERDRSHSIKKTEPVPSAVGKF